MKLTKSGLIDAICEGIDCQKNHSSELVETVLDIIKRTLEQGEDVLISGFGKFQVRSKSERRGRNPATGNEMMLDSRRVVTFKCSGLLREKVNRQG